MDDAHLQPDSDAARVRLMIADDHETVRQGLRALFASEPGIDVVEEVGDAETAVERVRSLVLDVVVMDLSMPKAGGLAAIRAIKKEKPDTAVVVLTRYSDPSFVREALSAGASAYVLKQSPFAEVRSAVSAVMAGHRYLDHKLQGLDVSVLGEEGRPVTSRETDVLRRTALGQSNKAIAVALDISIRTVEVHKTNGMRKLGLRDRSDLVRHAKMQGWLAEV